MRILMVASEAAPLAKTGSLADVVGPLPRAPSRLGHTVDLVGIVNGIDYDQVGRGGMADRRM
jgi:hypothetical protein